MGGDSNRTVPERNPSGVVNPYTLKVLRERFEIDASDARSKFWQEFEKINFDFVITVCDKARETCPVWPGQPVIAHWGADDPAVQSFLKDWSECVWSAWVSRQLEPAWVPPAGGSAADRGRMAWARSSE